MLVNLFLLDIFKKSCYDIFKKSYHKIYTHEETISKYFEENDNLMNFYK